MKKIIIYIAISFIVISAKAQHITYADFMKLVKIEQWSAINDAIYPKGYRFAGSKTYYEKTDSAYFEAVWCKNCTYNFYNKRIEWDNNVQRSFLSINISKSVEYQYIFTGKQAFSTFMSTAKANRFKYLKEGMFPNCISIWYKRTNTQKDYDELMRFNEYTDKFEVYYWKEPHETKISSSVSSSSSTSTSKVKRKDNTDSTYSHTPIINPEDVEVPPPPSPLAEPIEIEPSFPGGLTALLNWLSTQVHYPIEAEKKGIQGKVVVSFVVETDGSISNVQVVLPVCPEIDAEAVRVVKSMPRWNPATQNGTPVRIKYNLPITFTLEDKGEKSK